MAATLPSTLASLRPQSKLSLGCITLPDGTVSCTPPGICAVLRCDTDGNQTACAYVPEPCTQTVPINGGAALAICVIALGALGAWKAVRS